MFSDGNGCYSVDVMCYDILMEMHQWINEWMNMGKDFHEILGKDQKPNFNIKEEETELFTFKRKWQNRKFSPSLKLL